MLSPITTATPPMRNFTNKTVVVILDSTVTAMSKKKSKYKLQSAFENYLSAQYEDMIKPSPFLQAVKKYQPDVKTQNHPSSEWGWPVAQATKSELEFQYGEPHPGNLIVESIDQAQKSITLNMAKASTPTFQVTAPWYLTDAEKAKADKVYSYEVVPQYFSSDGILSWANDIGPSNFFGIDKSTTSTTHTFKAGDIVQNKLPYPETWTIGEVVALDSFGHAIIAVLFPHDKQDVTFQNYISNLTLVPHKEI